jgi:anti-sigma factor RsiW
MNLQTAKISQTCPREEISLYLDGELSLADELVLEKHLAVCKICRTEINLHKKMFSALDLVFEAKPEVELPKNFAKVVAAKAESEVNGLRSKEERFRASFLCAGLFLLTLLGLGIESDRLFSSFGGQIVSVFTVAFHSILDFAVGIAVVLRCLSQKAVVNPVFLLVLTVSAGALMFITFSRLRLRFSRS